MQKLISFHAYICSECYQDQFSKESRPILSPEIQLLRDAFKAIEPDKVLKILTETQALLSGHFELSSGLHSSQYIQCAKALQHGDIVSELCFSLAGKCDRGDISIEVVIGPALGAITLAYEVAQHLLNARALFTEREKGKMTLRRGFEIQEGENVLVVEDVLTTGGSVKEVMEVVHAHGGNVVGVGALVDRSDGKLDLGVPVHALLKISVEKYPPEDCPLCKQGIPLVKPGSKRQC